MASAWLPLLAAVFLAAPVLGADGEALFHDNGCGACHKPDLYRVGPSLRTIAEAYAEAPESLSAFLKGEGKPIFDPEKYRIMERQMKATIAMSDAERATVASYILEYAGGGKRQPNP
jgi:cytochrome c